MLARLLFSLPALSDSPHRHLQTNHSNNTERAQDGCERPHTLTESGIESHSSDVQMFVSITSQFCMPIYSCTNQSSANYVVTLGG